MNKQKIISEIRRIAMESDGKAPGFQRFSTETGVRKSDWYPNLWLRWGDAISEAGCQPNDFISAYDTNFLIIKYIELIRELGHFPIEGELRIKKKTTKDFPSHSGFSQLGSKQERVQKIVEYCQGKNDFDDIVEICQPLIASLKAKEESIEHIKDDNKEIGHVYLLKHDKVYKIGKSIDASRRYKEIRIQMPQKTEEIHVIATDDPSGIEAYWHNRFKDKKLEGEWFKLSPDDVKAFKKRKFM
jgi:hypothetical protein